MIMLGDVVPMLSDVPDNSFDAIFADWPYSQMSPVRGKDNGAAGRIYGPQAFLHRVLQQFHRVAAAGCHLYLFGDWRGIPDNGYAMSTTGWFPTTIIVWDKCYVGTGGFWRSSWDPIWFASKGPADKRTATAHANVIRVPAVRRRAEHPAEKPKGLWEELCTVSVAKGTRVLDAFAGSGSSYEPVQTAGGVWFGVDIDPTWSHS
jgi:site-specific DNA-methyltransferase (adenine-specific)